MSKTTFPTVPEAIRQRLGQEAYDYLQELHRVVLGEGYEDTGALDKTNLGITNGAHTDLLALQADGTRFTPVEPIIDEALRARQIGVVQADDAGNLSVEPLDATEDSPSITVTSTGKSISVGFKPEEVLLEELGNVEGGEGISIGTALVWDGQKWVPGETGSLDSGAPAKAKYLVLGENSKLKRERIFTPGLGLSGADGGENKPYTLALDAALDDLNNVSAAGASNGHIIKHNGTQWVLATDSTGGGGSTAMVVDKVTASGVTVTLTQTPSGVPFVTVPSRGAILDEVGSSPGANEFTRSGNTLTLGSARSGQTVQAVYNFSGSQGTVEALNPGGYPTNTGSLANTPTDVDDVFICLTDRGAPLDRVGASPGPNEYTLTAGGVYVLGRNLEANGEAIAIYTF
jgi:hypothetical protein